MSEFKQYQRTAAAEMRPYVKGESLPLYVSISDADLKNGSPKEGDMIARNPKDHRDQWLVSAEYFADNFCEKDNVADRIEQLERKSAELAAHVEISLELARALENKGHLPRHMWALKCSHLVEKVKQSPQTSLAEVRAKQAHHSFNVGVAWADKKFAP